MVSGSYHAPNVPCHAACCVNVLRVNKFRAVQCHKPSSPSVHAMSRPPCSLSAHWPTKENRQTNMCCILSVHGAIGLKCPQMGPGVFFLVLIQTLPTFWATWTLILRIFSLLIFWFPDFHTGPGRGLGQAAKTAQ